MSRHLWTHAELQLLRELYPDMHTDDVAALLQVQMRQVYGAASRLGLHKTPEYKASVTSGRIQRAQNDPRMRVTQFRPGSQPWNKGQRFEAGGRSALTRFKPGHKGSRTQPIGSYRLDAQGLLQRKVADTPGPNHLRWRGVHELIWIEAHGPVPAGHVVCFRPGQRTNRLEEITLERVECLSRAQIARRNHPANKSPELARLVQLKGAITRQVNRIAREAAQEQPA